MKKFIILTAVIIAVLVGVGAKGKGFARAGSKQVEASSTLGVTGQDYTLDEVKKHDNKNSCWSALNGKVYNLTDWINQHPGGSIKILMICGKDGSTVYNLQHQSQTKANDKLAEFYIGELSSN